MNKNSKRRIKSSVKKKFKILLFLVIISIIIGKYLSAYISSVRFTEENGQIIESSSIQDNNPSYDEVSSAKNNIGTIEERLNKLKEQDSRINTIISNYNDYPEELIDMLSRNIDMLDFVLKYPEKNGKVYSDNIGKVNKGTIPLLLQWDERWGYANYGDNIIAVNGCGPTALSMVITGLTGDNTITPYTISKFSIEHGFYIDGTGTSWNLMTGINGYFGIRSKELSLDKNIIFNNLRNGNPIICSMRSGDFTTTGHFIVLTGIEDGKIKVNDPNSMVRSSLLWDYDRIAPQIKNLWVFYVK